MQSIAQYPLQLIAGENIVSAKQRFFYSLFGSLAFSLIANAFAYFNWAPRHDALNHAFHFAGDWEVSLGRFLEPIYGAIRGNATMPWLTGLLATFYVAVAVVLITELLGIRNSTAIILSSGCLMANYTIVELCATFTACFDGYMLSLVFACAGVYCVQKIKGIRGCLIAAAFFWISLGIYQAFIAVALILFILIALQDVLQQQVVWKHVLRNWLRWILSLLLGGGGVLIRLSFILACQKYSTRKLL